MCNTGAIVTNDDIVEIQSVQSFSENLEFSNNDQGKSF